MRTVDFLYANFLGKIEFRTVHDVTEKNPAGVDSYRIGILSADRDPESVEDWLELSRTPESKIRLTGIGAEVDWNESIVTVEFDVDYGSEGAHITDRFVWKIDFTYSKRWDHELAPTIYTLKERGK